MANAGQGLGTANGVGVDDGTPASHPSSYRLLQEADPVLNGGRLEVAFIDSSLPDYETLVAGVKPGMAVVLIDGSQDGLSQMAAWAETRSGFDAVHVLGHGAEGTLQLGSLTLDSAMAEARAEDLAKLGTALTDDGDLLLYGCDVAGGEGEAFVAQLAAATGADVAASDDATGPWAVTADWDLEMTSGEVTSQSVSVLGYAFTLNIVGSTVTDNYASSGTVGDGVEIDYGSGAFKVDISASSIVIEGIGSSVDPYSLTFSGGSIESIDSINYDAANSTVSQSDYSGFVPTISSDGLTISWTALAGNNSGNNKIAYTISTTATGGGDTTAPTASVTTVSVNNTTDVTTAQSTETGTLYLVKDGSTVTDKASLDTLAAGNDANSATVTSADTNTTISTTGLVDGSYHLYAVDSAGNVSAQSTNAVTLDSTAPNAPGAPDLNATTDSGASNSDNITNSLVPKFRVSLSGTNAVSGDTIELLQGGASFTTPVTATLSATDISNGYYDFTLSSGALGADGSKVLTATLTDLAGNASSAGASLTLTLDTTAPTVTSVARQTPSGETTNADTLVYRVTFNESVSNVGTDDFSVTGTTGTVTGVTGSGTTYDITVSGGDLASANGTVSLGFAGGQNIADTAGNALASTTPTGTNQTYTLDNSSPTVTSIARQTPSAETTNADSLVYRVTFSESVSNVGTADFTVTGTTGTVSGVTGSGTTYDVTVSGGDLASANGTITLGFAGGQDIADSAGNTLASTTPIGTNQTYTLDNSSPTVTSIARQTPSAETTNADSLVYRVTFSESVSNVGTADFTVTGTTGTVSGVSGSGTTYDVTVSGGDLASANGTIALGFAGGQDIADGAGNTLASTTPTGTNQTYTLDNSSPTVTSIARQTPSTETTDADTLVYRVTFSESVSNVGTADFTVTGTTGTVSGVSGSGTTYDVTVSGGDLASANGTVALGFAGGQDISDGAGNALTNTTPTGTNESYTLNNVVDTVAPTVASIARQTPSAETTNADSLIYRVTFSESVANVGTADFSVTGTTGTVTGVTGSGTTYDVTVSGGDLASANGTVTLGFAGGQDIADAANNALTNTTPSGADESYTLDNAGPTVTSIARQTPSEEATTADSLVYRVTFSENVSNVGAADFTVTGTTGTVTGVTGSGTTYDVTVSGGNIVYTSGVVTLGFVGGQDITDVAGNALTNTTPTGANQSYTLDNSSPNVTSIVRQTPNTETTDADTLVYRVTFNENVTNVGAADFTVTGTTGTVTGVSGSGSTYDVTVSGGDLASLNGTVKLGFAAGQDIADIAGNTLFSTTPSGTNNATFTVVNQSSSDSGQPAIVVTTTNPTTPSTGGSGTTTSQRITNNGTSSGSAAIVQNTNNNGNLVTATLPPSTTISSEGPTTAQSPTDALTTLVTSIQARGSTAETPLVSGARTFLNKLATTSTLDVRTIIPTTTSSSLSSPIVITGTSGGSQSEAFVVDLRSLPSGSTLQLDNIEFASVMGSTTVTGGAGNNYVTGDDNSQFISLGVGDDTLFGGAGADTIGSGSGRDFLYGNEGSDRVFGGTEADAVYGGQDDDVVYGNQANDLVYGNRGADTLYGGQDDDTLYGGQQDDLVHGNASQDLLYGNTGADTLFGDAGNDVLYGDEGADRLSGGSGNDTLYGGLSSDNGADGESYDILYGGAGDDVFYGGEGVDWIYTGEGADRIVIETLNGFDVIADFDVAAGDRLAIASNVNGLTLTDAADVIARASDNPDGDVEFDLGGQHVRLIGVRTADLTADYFELF